MPPVSGIRIAISANVIAANMHTMPVTIHAIIAMPGAPPVSVYIA